jgi:GGDEF domain-containing protein
MYSRRGFLRQLSRLSEVPSPQGSGCTLLATEIDWFHGIVQKGGQNAADRVLTEVARAIKTSAGEAAITAYLENGRFLTLLQPQSAALVKGIAERIANDYGCRESQRDSLGQPTLTTAIVPWNAALTPEELVDAGLEALTLAKQSGGDCVLECGEYQRELSAWSEEVANGNPFASVVAQDIMEYFPALLTCDQDQSATIAALRRAGVPVCPYVDRSGRLTGVASAEPGADTNGTNSPAALPIRKPETIRHNASFADIYEAFSTHGSSTLIVVADDHPLGYLTFQGFLSLVEPVSRDTFDEVLATGDDSRQLIVPSLSTSCAPE